MKSQNKAVDVYNVIGRNMSLFRQKRGLTQAELAEAISLSRTSVTNIENGRQKIMVHTLLEIALVLGASVTDLLPTMDQSKSASVKNQLLLEMSEEDRKFIAEIVGSELREEES